MSPDTWRRVDRILNGALDLPPGERTAFVAAECGGDASLAAQVNALLLAHDDAQELFEPPALAPGLRLGAYTIVREIGRGGMGIVYLAERSDEQFRKQVAVKIVGSVAASPEFARRFRTERQILARLEHPNIARLLDAGATRDGVRYIVMEYVDGVRLDAYCHDRRLPEAERLSLFRQICSAVQLAHRHMIVHRDIKPGNILVAGDGVPKLLDFGIAKILDLADERRDVTAVRAMTPEFASPELASGQPVTTATDIYSLGVVLRKLLAADSPEKQAAPDADLKAIIARATQPAPDERYASADELSADIGRHLDGLPVLARARSARYIVGKFVRRHRLAVAVAVAVFLAAVGGVVAIVRETQIARQERAKAQFRFEQVRKLARSMMYELHDAIVGLPGSTPVRALLVQRSLEYLDSLAKEGTGDDGLQKELADAYRRIAAVQGKIGASNLGDQAGALASFTKAIAILRGLNTRHPGEVPVVTDLTFILGDTSTILLARGRKEEALGAAREAVRFAEALNGGHPDDEAVRSALGAAYFNLALMLDGDAALAMWRRTLDVYQADLGRKPSDPNNMRNVALVHKYMENWFARKKDWAECVRQMAAARDLDAKRLTLAPNNRMVRLDLTFDLTQLAAIRYGTGEYNLALTGFDEVIALRKQLADEDPQDANLKQRLAFARLMRGNTLLQLSRVAAAAAELREVLQMAGAFYERDRTNLTSLTYMAEAHLCLGDCATRWNRRAESCAEYREARRMYVEVARHKPHTDEVEINAERAARLAAACDASGHLD